MKQSPRLVALAAISIVVLAAIHPSGKCLLLKPDADLPDLDPSKLARFHFEAEARNTGHTIRAGEATFEVLNAAGIEPDETTGYSAPAYNGANRVALGVVRCARFRQEKGDGQVQRGGDAQPLTASEFLALPTAVQEKYLSELDKADRMGDEDWDFFKAAPAKAGAPAKEKTSSSGVNEKPAGKSGDATA